VDAYHSMFEGKGGVVEANRFTQSLATYADHAPPHVQAERLTLQGKLLEEFRNRPGVYVGPKSIEASKAIFQQGRSFKALQGFHRVGGVLIGRELGDAGPSPLDVTDVRWEADGSNLSLILVQADGREFRSRPHRKSLVRHALAYAADGRKITV